MNSTIAEFMRIIQMTLPQLADFVRGKGGRFTMQLRRVIQHGMSEYAKTMPQHMRGDDKVLEKAVAMTAKLEKWARLDYEATETGKMMLTHPGWPAIKIKRAVRKDWEDIVKRESY